MHQRHRVSVSLWELLWYLKSKHGNTGGIEIQQEILKINSELSHERDASFCVEQNKAIPTLKTFRDN